MSQIQAEIFNHGPVQANMDVFGDFFSYETGTVRCFVFVLFVCLCLCVFVFCFSSFYGLFKFSNCSALSGTTRLWVPRTKKRAGDSSFNVAAPRLWNDLPVPLR